MAISRSTSRPVRRPGGEGFVEPAGDLVEPAEDFLAHLLQVIAAGIVLGGIELVLGEQLVEQADFRLQRGDLSCEGSGVLLNAVLDPQPDADDGTENGPDSEDHVEGDSPGHLPVLPNPAPTWS